ncbi:HAD family hydrolase [uncultured Jatrophihabitans sp.]|uniref:HAD family hydrolase n=1 Tax=uncultured Jatrophihabitans sp. TaxID=1610747 RepID=UPI0035CA6B36
MIRLVATDLDGTLLRSDNTVSDRTRAALQAAAAAGLLVVFVTGRPPRWLDDVVDETGHVGVAVGANGAVIYDMASERIITAHTLPETLLHDLTMQLRGAFPSVGFAVEFGHTFAAEPGYTHDWDVNPETDRRGNPIAPPHIGTVDEIVTAPAVKLLAKDREADADEFLAAATELVGDRATITHSSSFGLLELSAPGVTKATGLAEVAATHGIDASEVVAIGDMPNDVPMLRWAGRSYAVANAHPAAVEAADETVGANDDDAVAVLIESLLTPPGDQHDGSPGFRG